LFDVAAPATDTDTLNDACVDALLQTIIELATALVDAGTVYRVTSVVAEGLD
jgi:hypothetical protein